MTKILLVEDEEFLRDLYSRSLRLKNYEVETAVDSEDALVKLKLFKPDVVILDIILPRLNGIEVLKMLKNDPRLKRIPVIMLTGVSEINKIKECLDIGAIGYILKGSSADEITEKINLIVSSSKNVGA
jgi:DNA-binding response OmpR family regulator